MKRDKCIRCFKKLDHLELRGMAFVLRNYCSQVCANADYVAHALGSLDMQKTYIILVDEVEDWKKFERDVHDQEPKTKAP